MATIVPSQASTLVKELSQASPLPGLQHLKRIQRLDTVCNSAKSLAIILHALSNKPAIHPEGHAWAAHELLAEGVPPAVITVITKHSLELRLAQACICQAPSPLQRCIITACSTKCHLRQQRLAVLPMRSGTDGSPQIDYCAIAASTEGFVQGAKNAPRTREQLTEWSKLWPISWRQPDTVSSAPQDSLTAGEALSMQSMMLRLLEMAEQPCLSTSELQKGRCSDSSERSTSVSKMSSLCNMAVIVDPQTSGIVVLGRDNTGGVNRHPLHHAAMTAVHAAAQRDLQLWPPASSRDPGAADPHGLPDRSPAGQLADESAHPAEAGQQGSLKAQPASCPTAEPGSMQEGASKALCEPGKASTSGLATYVLQGSETSRHNAKRRCLDKGDGTFDSHLGTDACSNAAPHHAHPPGASAAAAASRSADGQCDVSGAELGSEQLPTNGLSSAQAPAAGKPYLCTGLDCYMIHEPCAMCAMALVHSRVRRVVFAVPDALHGALGGAFRLHGQTSLNHHYQVYRLCMD